jgi:hypothetical protein
MFGQTNHNGHRYYRHCHTHRDRKCTLHPKPWVRADKLEAAVLQELFATFGNPAAIERAIKQAIPDCDHLLRKREHIEEEVGKNETAVDRILDHVAKETISQEQADRKLKEIKERKTLLLEERDRLNDALAELPDAELLKRIHVQVEEFADGTKSIFLYDDDGFPCDEDGNPYTGGNDLPSWFEMLGKEGRKDRRALIESVFNEPMGDGTPSGVYISPVGGARFGPKPFSYQIKGRLIERKGSTARARY